MHIRVNSPKENTEENGQNVNVVNNCPKPEYNNMTQIPSRSRFSAIRNVVGTYQKEPLKNPFSQRPNQSENTENGNEFQRTRNYEDNRRNRNDENTPRQQNNGNYY